MKYQKSSMISFKKIAKLGMDLGLIPIICRGANILRENLLQQYRNTRAGFMDCRPQGLPNPPWSPTAKRVGGPGLLGGFELNLRRKELNVQM
jgi:hypothetical protein